MRYVEGIFTSVCTSLCVRSFSAILGLENRLVNKEIMGWLGGSVVPTNEPLSRRATKLYNLD